VCVCVKNCPTLIYLFNIKVLSETPLKCPFCQLASQRAWVMSCCCYSVVLLLLLLLLFAFVVGSLNIKKVFSSFFLRILLKNENENKFKMH